MQDWQEYGRQGLVVPKLVREQGGHYLIINCIGSTNYNEGINANLRNGLLDLSAKSLEECNDNVHSESCKNCRNLELWSHLETRVDISIHSTDSSFLGTCLDESWISSLLLPDDKPSLHNFPTEMESGGGDLMCSFCSARSENDFNHKPKNTIVARCSILKANTESKTNMLCHNHTFGGFKSMVVVLYASHLQLLTYKLTFKKVNCITHQSTQ